MLNTTSVVLVGLGAALAFALSSSLKHLSSGQVPDAQDFKLGALGVLVRSTVVNRFYLIGTASDVLGVVLQAVALRSGSLSLVQPLLLTSLLFALILRARFGSQRLTRAQNGWAILLITVLGSFVAIAAPSTQLSAGPTTIKAVIAGACVLTLVVSCLVVVRRLAMGGRKAALMGIAVGAVYACTAALLKAVTSIGGRGFVALLTGWELYAALVLGAVGLLLGQVTFQAGPLATSLPATATVDTILSVALGIIIYGDRVADRTVLGGAIILGCGVLAGLAATGLSRSTASEP